MDRFQVRDFPLRQRLAVITRRPGLTPWPKLFANLRSSRATELVQDFLPYVVTAWVGHTPAIAEAHYWQVTEEHSAEQRNPQRRHCVTRVDKR